MKRLFVTAVAFVAALALAVPASAITAGTPDGDRHPMVGLLFYELPGAGWFVCTGTAITPRVLVTAGHCTDGAQNMHVTFDEVPVGLQQIAEGRRKHPGTWHRGVPHTHPRYDAASFFMADLGVVVLDAPVSLPAYGQLPEVGYLDAVWRSKTHDRTFTPVGYGIDSMVPRFDWTLTRQWSTSRLINLTGTHGIPAGTVAVFSNNRGVPHTGGTCNGDSGGPYFERDTFLIGAVTSYGISPCIGTDGAYRLDKQVDLDWIADRVADSQAPARAGRGGGPKGK